MLKIDYVLTHFNIQQNTTQFYNVGNCVFDSISSLLNFKEIYASLRFNSMQHLKDFVMNNTPKACETRI